jgi:hypothetical protein
MKINGIVEGKNNITQKLKTKNEANEGAYG